MSWGQDVADLLRAASIPVAVVTAAISLRVVVDRRYRSGSQLFRFLGLAILTLGLAFGEYHSLNRPPYWPALILLSIGLALSAAGTVPLFLARMRSESLKPAELDDRL